VDTNNFLKLSVFGLFLLTNIANASKVVLPESSDHFADDTTNMVILKSFEGCFEMSHKIPKSNWKALIISKSYYDSTGKLSFLRSVLEDITIKISRYIVFDNEQTYDISHEGYEQP
jgi:hypothetical protein